MIQINKNDKHLNGVVGDADALGPAVFGVGLGAATETKFRKRMVLIRTRTNKEKKAVLVSVWLKESLLKEYYNTNKLINII